MIFLLGTQMVAKGHDIPTVTAVGIISADSSLNLPDLEQANVVLVNNSNSWSCW